MGGGRVAGVDRAFVDIELRLVGDVAHCACLRSGAVQSSLRTFQHLDSSEVGSVDVEVSSGKLYRLIVEIDGHIGKSPGATHDLASLVSGGEAPQVNLVLSRSDARGSHVGQIP